MISPHSVCADEEAHICALTVRMQRKLNSVAKFDQTLANDILPLLRTQPGFQDEMTLFVPGAMEVAGIGLGAARARRSLLPQYTYPAELRALAHVVEGGRRRPLCGAHMTFHTSLAGVPQLDAERALVGGGDAKAALSLVWCVIAITHWTF